MAKDRNDSNKIVDKLFKEADDTVSKTDTLKSSTQVANERVKSRDSSIRKSRQQRLEERRSLVEKREQARQELLNKQAEQEAAYQEYLKSK